MGEIFLVVKSTRDAISDIANSGIEGDFSEPELVGSPADVLDAPLDPGQIKEVLQMITAAFGTATALLNFIQFIISKSKEKQKEFILMNPQNGRTLAVVNKDSIAEEVFKTMKEL